MWTLVAIAIEGLALAGVLSVAITGSTRVAFLTGFNTMAVVTGLFLWHEGLSTRGILVVTMVGGYLVRMNWMLLFWAKQTAVSKLDGRIPALQKLFLPVILTNTVGWGYSLPVLFAIRHTDPVGVQELLGISVYLLGTALHFGSDYQKRRFKLRPENAGRLLDTGFWAISRHPNYFGDFLIYVSFAIVGGSVWGWIAPALNVAQYAFDAIPKNENWAAERYGAVWDAYKQRTKSFVPHVI